MPAAQVVGDAACKPCHDTIFQQHRVSPHALTLQAMDRADLGLVTPPVGPIPHSQFAIERQGHTFTLARKDSGVALGDPAQGATTLIYAYGSGKNGVSYIAIDPKNTLVELHYSYVPHLHKWRVTPGQENLDPHSDHIGITRVDEEWRICQACHGVITNDSTLRPDPRIQGVGCESCHGPASNHVASMRKGTFKDLQIARMGTWTARKIGMDCGRCHRTGNDLIPGAPPAAQTARFQPYGLMLSRCFVKSGDSLTCLTCHDPHGDTPQITRLSEQACKTCHSTRPSLPLLAGRPAVRGSVCRVNQNSGCVGCHMPRRPAYGLQDIQMADHDIRIWRKDNHPLR